MNDFYTYTLAYPDGTVFYVGKGHGYRWLDHEREARQGFQSHKCSIIRKIWTAGEQVVKRKVEVGLCEEAAYQAEMHLIAKHGRASLANLTDGGEGGSGRPVARKGRYRPITLEVRSDLLAKIDASSKSRREYIEALLEQ